MNNEALGIPGNDGESALAQVSRQRNISLFENSNQSTRSSLLASAPLCHSADIIVSSTAIEFAGADGKLGALGNFAAFP